MYTPSAFFRRRVAVRRVRCTVCNEERLASGVRSVLFLHIFGLPVLPVARSVDWVCLTCDKDVDASRPNHHPMRPAISGCGLAAAWLLVFMGALGLLIMHLMKEKGDIGPPILILLAGLAFAVTLLRQRRDARRSGYEALAAAATPLSGDHCPLCAAKLSAGKPARCAHCEVEVVTG